MITTKFKPCVNACFAVRIFSVAGKGRILIFLKDVSRSIASRDLFCFITNLVNTGVNHSSQIHARNGDTLVNTVFHIHCVAFRSPGFSVLFLPGLDN